MTTTGTVSLTTHSKRNQCDTINAGTLIQFCIRAGLWPTRASARRSTVTEIVKSSRSIESFGCEIIESDSQNHAGCCLKSRLGIAIESKLEGVKGLDIQKFTGDGGEFH